MSAIFGLDFGTTNSSLAVLKDGDIEVLKIDPMSPSSKSLKSVIFFDEEGDVFVGQEAINHYLEMGGEYCRFMRSLKTFLPSKSFDKTYVFGKKYGLEDLISIILKVVKTRGESYLGQPVEDVVLGRPVIFSPDKEKDALAEKRLETAARKVGFKNIRFQYEPVAAALSCEKELKHGEEKLLFMGDFGGGTSDFTVMRLRGGHLKRGDRKEDVLSIDGISIAGDIFDSLLMKNKIAQHFGRDVKYPDIRGHSLHMPYWIINTLCQWHLIPQLRKSLEFIRRIRLTADDRRAVKNLERLIVENLGFAVFQSIEMAKCELSSEESSSIFFEDGDIRIRETLSRTEFETIISEEVARIKGCIEETLKKAGVSGKDIERVVVTGGSSFIPKIRRLFTEIFGEGKLEAVDAFTSVAYGLGVTASMI